METSQRVPDEPAINENNKIVAQRTVRDRTGISVTVSKTEDGSYWSDFNNGQGKFLIKPEAVEAYLKSYGMDPNLTQSRDDVVRIR